MSLKIEDLETFKRHRYAVSESLSTDIVGRDREIEEISSKIDSVYCLTITGPAGVGKADLLLPQLNTIVPATPISKSYVRKASAIIFLPWMKR